MRFTKFLLLFTFTLISLLTTSAQDYTPPMRIPPSLSANFGELRNNHFHSGLDYTTQYAVNKPIYSVADGYVSRINVSPGGYGLALYVDHPETGHTSVYGHLNSFSKKIADYFIAKQYEHESYRLDIQLAPNEIPVKQGEQIALSGNTGSSGGPHLHFELRDTKTEEPLDVLNYLGHHIRDNIRPELRGIAIYPQTGTGLVNGSAAPLRMNIARTKEGGYAAPPRTINAWGTIGAGLKAYDKMPGRNNIYGVKTIKLYVDEALVYKSEINRFSFDETRMLNSFIDFEDWRLNKSFFMKSFVEPGNKLRFYQTLNSGFININLEKNYRFRYELTDHYGNKTVYSFIVKGVKQEIPAAPKCDQCMALNLANSWVSENASLSIPMGNLYTDVCFKASSTASQKYYSDIYQLNDKPVPLHRAGQLKIRLKRLADVDSTRYGIVKIDRAGKESWIGGSYNHGEIEANINELGDRYAVDIDTQAPVITPVNPAQWASQRKIVVTLRDSKSGIASFRGEINGKFVLFKHDIKSPNYTYVFDDSRLVKGQKQHFVFTATDGTGNKSEYKYEFYY